MKSILASPRSFCAGVERAIETVERALERYGAPVYVRRQIVHNLHVVRDLESQGAVFVEEIEDVPQNAVVVLAAHGVSPGVRRQAAERTDLRGDRRDLPAGRQGAQRSAQVREPRTTTSSSSATPTMRRSSGRSVKRRTGSTSSTGAADVDRLELSRAVRSRTSPRRRLPPTRRPRSSGAARAVPATSSGPPADDICYATQNRQDAVRLIAHRCDLMLVVGSANSVEHGPARGSGPAGRLSGRTPRRRLAARAGWLAGASTIGLTAGASAPDGLVQEVLDSLRSLGPIRLSEEATTEETVRFAIPTQVR